jgi:Ca-activated chloride channel homolog
MTFLWPEALVLLAAVPLAIAFYFLVLRRRKKLALRYASLSLLKPAIGGRAWRRHLPPLVFLLALVMGIVALARPAAVMWLPSQHETVILSIDISGSMRATDVAPDRITAAQEAAKAFVAGQPGTTRIGVVAFGGTATLVQPATTNRSDVIAAIERLHPQRATAIGAGILVALKAIFPELEIDLYAAKPGQRPGVQPRRDAPGAYQPALKPVPPGSYGSAVIVLLTDGTNTSGPDPIEAAKMAADRGVRVYTVGIGTASGTIVMMDGWSMNVRLDEETLKQVANITRAEYFFTNNAADLRKIYNTLNSRFALEKKQTEITVFFSAAATLLGFLSAALSLVWFSRIL